MDRQRRLLETFGFRKRLEHFRDLVARESRTLGRRLRIVDVGCGTGLEVTDPLARDGHTVVGIDIHLPSLTRGRIATYVCGDTRALRSGTFDVAICSEVLEHMHRPLDLLLETRRVLVPGGLCLVTVPNGYGPYEATDRAGKISHAMLRQFGFERLAAHPSQQRGGTDTLNYSSGHLTFFSLWRIRELFQAAGFRETGYRGRTLLCGAVLSETVALHARLVQANAWAADMLPPTLVSDWMFSLRAT